MMKERKFVQAYYTLLQIFYWISIGFTFSYASVYLQSRGAPNGQIGLVLAAAYILAALLQPIIAAIIDRWEIPLARGVIVIYGIAAALAVLLYVLPMPVALVLAVMAVDFSLLSALQPSVNSLAKVLEKLQLPVNFGAARGTGSLVYAIVMAIMGQVLQRVSPLFLPLSYAAVSVISIILLLSFRPILQGKLQLRAAAVGGFPAPKEYPWFWVFLVSVVCLSIGEGFFTAFLLQIMQNVGGDSGTTGLAMGVCASIEFVSMLFYSRFSKKFGVHRLMIFAGWAWIGKTLLMYLAQSPTAIYAAYLLQFVTYAFYIPGSIELVSKILPEKSFLKGQSLTVSAYTLGCVFASVLGGAMLDTIGVHDTLGILIMIMTVGAVLMTLANLKKKA